MLKILVSGGNGRFAGELKKIKTNYKFIPSMYPDINIKSHIRLLLLIIRIYHIILIHL